MGWCICTLPKLGHAQDLSQLLAQLNKSKDDATKIPILYQIGFTYQQKNTYKKAIEYFLKANQIEKDQDLPQKKSLENLGYAYKELGNYAQAIQYLEEIIAIEDQSTNQDITVLKELALLYNLNKQYNKAISYTQKILVIYQQSEQTELVSNTYNNLGYLYKKAGDRNKALEHYQKAIAIIENSGSLVSGESQAIAYINAGVAYTSLGDFKQARTYYQKAIRLREQEGKPAQIADANNYLAVYYYLAGNNTKAINQVNKAIALAQPIKAEQVLVSSYKILSDIYQQEQAFEASQKYFKQYQQLKDKLAQQQRDAQKKVLQKQVEVEKEESKLKELIAEKNQKEAQLKQSELERQKQDQELKLQQQELALLKHNQDLQKAELKNQQLEKERVEQLLALAEQENRVEKQRLLTEKQKREAEKQKLIAAKEKAEKLQQTKALQAAQNEKKLQQEQLKQEKKLRQYSNIALVLGSLLFVFVLFSFAGSQRARRKLKQQNRKIQSQKEELQQNQDEILAQRDFIEQKHREMEFANHKLMQNEHVLRKAYDKISKSISAAKTIQKGILPHPKKVQDILGEHFVIFEPKDVVSGDFYWVKSVNNYRFVIAADCTGHGVPGAMMSMIGKSSIDKVILIKNICDPAQILTQLHHEIKQALRQEETGNNNGMDIIVLRLDDLDEQRTQVTFSAAKNPLYYVESEQTEIKTLYGDRRSIGGDQSEDIPFTNQEVVLSKGSLLYLGSDGFVDQNDVKRKRFGSKKLIRILEDCCEQGLEQQKATLMQALKGHMTETTQRDDILYIGVKI
ncbi:hypothetical protein BKI52_00920 [marine bacterium AO1-C]|nr:hypothetical protein BKI52_00920 [marine bacterium AO1-C]